MGFNLRQKLEETFADINPFDNGATAQTVRTNRVKAQPAQTVKKQQIQNRPMFQQNNQPAFTQQKQFKIQTQSPTINVNNSMPKVQTFGQSSDPLKVGQVKTPQIQLQVQQPTALQITAPTAQVPAQQPNAQAPKVYTPEAQQAYTDAKIIGTGSLSEVRQALTRTVDRKNSVKLDPQFKQGKSYEDIARDAGFSIDEVKRYAERNHKGYGDQGLLGNAARATGQFVGGMVKSGTNIVARPFNDLGDMDRSRGEAELQQINKDYRSGNITPAAAMERANALAGRYTTQKATFGDDGYIRIGSQSPVEFTGNIAQQGIDSASLLPVGGSIASGSARIASAVGKKTTANTLNKAASIMTAGAQTQATSKLANALTARGMNPQTANLVGNAITSNAKQSLVYGTAQTGADVASGRGITPESLAMNYGADFLMGAVPEIGLGSIGRGIDLNNAKVHQELIRTNPIYKANTDKLAAIDATIAQAQANGDIRALDGLQAVKAQLNNSNALIARRYAEQGFLGGKNATGFKDAEARGEVFTDTPDGLPRFEVDDSGAKIKNPNGSTLGEVLDHPQLFKNYPELASMPVDTKNMAELAGGYMPKSKRIALDAPDKGTVLHETQHAIQDIEGADMSYAPSVYKYDDAVKILKSHETVGRELLKMADAKKQIDAMPGKRTVAERKKIAQLDEALQRKIETYKRLDAGQKDAQNTINNYNNSSIEAEARAVQARMDMPMSERYVKPQRTRPQPTDNDFQNTLPSATRPASIKSIVDNGGNPLFHDTDSRGVLGIIESGELKPSQAPFSQLAGQGKRVSTTRNFDNYSRYGKAPYRFVLDERKTGQKAIPDNREEFESIFNKPVSTKAVESIAIDITNPALIGDLQNGTVDRVIEAAKAKGIKVEAFEGKLLPDVQANKEIQEMTRDLFAKNFPELAPKPRSTFYDSLDVPKEDLIVRNEGGKALSIEQIRNHPAIVELDNTIDHHNQQIAELKSAGHPDGFHTIKQHKKSIDVAIKEQNRIANELSRQGVAMSIEPKPKRTAKQVDAELKVMSDSPEFQEFYNGGKITGKSWNEYQRLSKEYRQLLDGAKDQPAGSMKPSKRDLRDYAKMLNDDEASQKAIGTQGLQNSKSGQRQSQGKRIRPTNQGTSSRSSQQSGQKNPLPDNKARTGRTYPDNTPDIDTAQYVKDMGRSQKSAMQSESGIKAKAADFKEKFIDDLSPIEDRLNKAIKDGASVDVKDHITYQLDRSRRAEGVMNAYVRDNGLDKIIQNVDNVDEFDQYLIARHAKELDPEITTGRDIAKDAALVRQLDGKYGEAAKELYKYNQKLLDTSVDYGLISKESAAALKKQYPDYVPFNRIFNEDELANLYGGAGKGDASLSSQNVVKKIKGSNRAIASPLNSIIDKTRVVVEQGERNRAAQMLANYRELPGNPYNLKEIPKNETIGTRHTISYLDKGVKRTFETDKVIADAAKNMTRQEIGLWGRIAAVPARVLRGGATTVNIGFAGANVVKDVIGAAINSKHPFRIADPKAFGKALSAALEHDGPYYQELMREGIAGTSFDMYRNPLKSNIGEIRSHKNLGTRAAYNVTHPSQWYRTLENTIGRSEDFGRALQYYSNKSGFEAKLGKGSKDAKTLAADQARHNSTNFFRHGSAGKGINLAIPYWNAGVQGARIQTRRIAERPVQTVAKIGFTIAAPSAMIAMNNYSTPERQEIMDNIQDYEKEGNIIILGANPHMNQETGKWEDVYKIPVPPQHIGIHTAVQDAVRSAKTGEGFDVLKNLGKITQNYTTVNPTNLRETASSYTPQALKLVAEPMTNTNFFTGNKIVPESQKNLPAKDQFGDYTSGTAKILGGITNISPRQIDNAIRTGTGGAGQNALWASDKMLAGTGAIEAKDVKGQDPLTSITRRFSGAASVSASDKAENLFKKYKEQVVQTNEYKNASQYDRQRMLNRLQNDLSAVEWDKTGKSEKNLTGKQKALKSDGFDPSVYTNLDSKTANKGTPKEKYDQTLKDYNDNKANMSEVQRFKKEKELATLKVKSNFDKDVVDLWGMSKADIYGLLTKDKDGNRKANELIKLDQAMYDAGLTKYLTFKNGIAPAQRGGTKRASTGRKGTGSRGGRARSAKGKFDYKLFGFSGSGGTSNSKQLHDLLKRAQLKVQK